MTPQEIFTKVATHLLAQNERSTDGQELVVQRVMGRCQYRGIRGLKCAIGYLIEDRFYRTSLEQNGIGDLRVEEALLKSGVSVNADNRRLLYALQGVHDRDPVQGWRTSLHGVAINFGLRFPEEIL